MLRRPLLLLFCVVVWVLFSVFSVICWLHPSTTPLKFCSSLGSVYMEVWGALSRSGNSLRWGNPLIHIVSLEFDHLYMIGAVTRRMLPHLSGVHFLQVNILMQVKLIFKRKVLHHCRHKKVAKYGWNCMRERERCIKENIAQWNYNIYLMHVTLTYTVELNKSQGLRKQSLLSIVSVSVSRKLQPSGP